MLCKIAALFAQRHRTPRFSPVAVEKRGSPNIHTGFRFNESRKLQ
jgi:hypothetical protein